MEENFTNPRSKHYASRIQSFLGNSLERLDIECADTGHPIIKLMYVDFKPAPVVRAELQMMMPEVEFAEISREYSQRAYLFYFADTYLCNAFKISSTQVPPTPLLDYLTSGLYNLDLSRFEITYNVIDKKYPENHEAE